MEGHALILDFQIVRKKSIFLSEFFFSYVKLFFQRFSVVIHLFFFNAIILTCPTKPQKLLSAQVHQGFGKFIEELADFLRVHKL